MTAPKPPTDAAPAPKRKHVAPTVETADAVQAFEDYWALGDERTLDKLVAYYRRQRDAGKPVPTTRDRTIDDWSRLFDWQGRLKARIAQESERTREEMRKRREAFRKRATDALEADLRMYMKRVAEGKAVLAQDAASMERMVKLFFQLTEEPLAERHELTGAGGSPLQPCNGGEIIERILAGIARVRSRDGSGSDPEGAAS